MPIESTSPNVAMPVISACTGPRVCTAMVADRVAALLGAAGVDHDLAGASSQLAVREAERRQLAGVPVEPGPEVGAAPDHVAVTSSRRASSEMLPTAFGPGSACTWSSVDAGMSARAESPSSSPASNAVLADTTAAVPS